MSESLMQGNMLGLQYGLECYGFRSVLAGTAGISRTGEKNGIVIPSIPPRIKFRPISANFGRNSFSGRYEFCLLIFPF